MYPDFWISTTTSTTTTSTSLVLSLYNNLTMKLLSLMMMAPGSSSSSSSNNMNHHHGSHNVVFLSLLLLCLILVITTSSVLAWSNKSYNNNNNNHRNKLTSPNHNNNNKKILFLFGNKKNNNQRDKKIESSSPDDNDDDDDDTTISSSEESSSNYENFKSLLIQQRNVLIEQPVVQKVTSMIKNSYGSASESASAVLQKASTWAWDELTFSAPFNYLLLDDEDSGTTTTGGSGSEGWSEFVNDEEYYYNEITGISNSAGTTIKNETHFTNNATAYTSSMTASMIQYSNDYLFHLPSSSQNSTNTKVKTKTITHFCFLLHGHRGLSKDLSYMQYMMRKQARHEQYKNYINIKKTIQQQQMEYNNNNKKKKTRVEDLKQDYGEGSVPVVEEGTATTAATTATTSTITKEDNNSWMDDNNNNNNFVLHDFVVHSVICNEKKTDDGVAAGGNRVVDEIITFIREYMNNKEQKKKKNRARNQKHSRDNNERKEEDDDVQDNNDDDDNNNEFIDVTISLVGNSLGGLYARYAVAELTERCTVVCETSNKNSTGKDTTTLTSTVMILDNRYRLHWNIFCTTATPHLGLSGHTFVPLPRTAEFGVARALGETGKDLFRLNTLLHEMATTSKFIKPMSYFRKRIAYANAYGTDFPVPASTAAFLSESSTYPHHFVNYDDDNNRSEKEEVENVTKDDMKNQTNSDNISKSRNELFVATLHTPSNNAVSQEHHVVSSQTGGDEIDEDTIHKEELARMSTSLDSLGWKKVFVDVRKNIPRISISKSLLRGRLFDSNEEIVDSMDSLSSTDSATSSSSITGESTTSESTITKSPIHQLKEKGIVSSKEIVEAVSTTPLLSTDSNEITLHWPAGHNMIVAFSRSRWSAYMNKAGRPVVDSLAKELVEDMFAFHLGESAKK